MAANLQLAPGVGKWDEVRSQLAHHMSADAANQYAYDLLMKFHFGTPEERESACFEISVARKRREHNAASALEYKIGHAYATFARFGPQRMRDQGFYDTCRRHSHQISFNCWVIEIDAGTKTIKDLEDQDKCDASAAEGWQSEVREQIDAKAAIFVPRSVLYTKLLEVLRLAGFGGILDTTTRIPASAFEMHADAIVGTCLILNRLRQNDSTFARKEMPSETKDKQKRAVNLLRHELSSLTGALLERKREKITENGKRVDVSFYVISPDTSIIQAAQIDAGIIC